MSFDLSGLNEEQLKPVLHIEGPVLVTAGAGSGKTRLLTHRIAHLIEDCHVKPYNILAITFTNKAADEMKGRLLNMVETEGLWVSTFHSMCVRILRRYAASLGYKPGFTIYGETEKEHVLKRIIKENSRAVHDDDFVKRASWHISNAKNFGFDPESYRTEGRADELDDICDVYTAYEAELKKCNAFDYDDLLLKAYQLLKTDEDAKAYYQNKFKYIHVDEFQDTNVIQYRLVRILGGLWRNIFVVGDEDQCIYGWRGANFENINDFIRDFNCTVYKLEQNYRSTKAVLGVANRLIAHNESRLEKVLWTENEDGDKPELYVANGENNEAEFVVNAIMRMKSAGHAFSDFAVLMRVNALSRAFEERMLAYNIPHKIYGGFKFYERKEIKDILAYLSVTENPADEEALLRIINFPKRGLGDGAVAQLRNYSLLNGQTLYETVVDADKNTELPAAIVRKAAPLSAVLKCLAAQSEVLNVAELTKYLVRMLNLKEVFGEDNEDNYSRKQNISALIAAMKQFCEVNPEAKLSDYLQMITLYSDTDEMDDSDCVTIATVHSAKGLEFNTVFVVGLEDGMFPISRSLDDPMQLEEERRLMYVAATRAEKKLFISYSNSRFMYGSRKYCVPSRFIEEMGFSLPKTQPSAAAAGAVRRAVLTEVRSQPPIPAVGYVPAAKQQPVRKDTTAFIPGTRVRHRRFGEGTVLRLSDAIGGNMYAEIDFDATGKMTLALDFAPLEVIGQEDV